MVQVTRSQPDYESRGEASARFRRALFRILGLIMVLWLVLAIDSVVSTDLRYLATRPRVPSGLSGLVFMPLLHGGIGHLVANSLPLCLLGVGLLFFYPQSSWRVLPWFWVLPGMFVWLVGEAGSLHYGISGLNFALLAYLSLGGILRREAGSLALSLVVMFYYGSMLSGVVPVAGISWESHLGGLLVGTLMAVIFRKYDIPPPRRYDWQDEEDEDQAVDGPGAETRDP
jgi:membrane associated rhomboid family serine protease